MTFHAANVNTLAGKKNIKPGLPIKILKISVLEVEDWL